MKRLPTSFSYNFLLLMAGCWLTACSSRPDNAKLVDEWPDIYPDYVGVTIPSNIAPLNFTIPNDSVTLIDVEVRGSRESHLHANGTYAGFDLEQWHQLLKDNQGDSLTLTVCALKGGEWIQYRDFSIYVSTDSIADWGITYRRIAPGYEMFGPMGIYQRCLSNFDETALIENTNMETTCLNCHTANRTNPAQYVFHARGVHGGTIIHNAQLEVLQARNDSLGGAMVYPYWHPGGRYVAFSTNKTSQMFHLSGEKRIEVYDSSSDVFVYDTETHTILKDTLIMKTYWAENTPAFSPDGNWLYFTTARRQVYPTDYDKELYSLCRVSFDAETGRIGNTVDTLISTEQTGKSASWPRPSYDGHFLMYTQTDYGYFSIWHPEADLWLLDLQTGATRPMEEVNSNRAESFHNWSSDSHWFIFTSRRTDGLYTQLFLSHIDEHGNATKPFMLPQEEPWHYYTQSIYSFNAPDFTSQRVETSAIQVEQRIKDPERIATVIQ